MQLFFMIFLLVCSASLQAKLLSHIPAQSYLSGVSTDDDCCDDENEMGEVDEDIIIMDEEDFNEDEGVNN